MKDEQEFIRGREKGRGLREKEQQVQRLEDRREYARTED